MSSELQGWSGWGWASRVHAPGLYLSAQLWNPPWRHQQPLPQRSLTTTESLTGLDKRGEGTGGKTVGYSAANSVEKLRRTTIGCKTVETLCKVLNPGDKRRRNRCKETGIKPGYGPHPYTHPSPEASPDPNPTLAQTLDLTQGRVGTWPATKVQRQWGT